MTSTLCGEQDNKLRPGFSRRNTFAFVSTAPCSAQSHVPLHAVHLLCSSCFFFLPPYSAPKNPPLASEKRSNTSPTISILSPSPPGWNANEHSPQSAVLSGFSWVYDHWKKN